MGGKRVLSGKLINLYFLGINISAFNCWRPIVFLPNKMFSHTGMNVTSNSIFDTEKQSKRLAFCKVTSTSSYETTGIEDSTFPFIES